MKKSQVLCDPHVNELDIKRGKMMKHRGSSVRSDSTDEEGMVLEVLDAVLTQPVLSTANEPTNQVLGVLGHVRYLLGELESLLCGCGITDFDKSALSTETEFQLFIKNTPCGS